MQKANHKLKNLMIKLEEEKLLIHRQVANDTQELRLKYENKLILEESLIQSKKILSDEIRSLRRQLASSNDEHETKVRYLISEHIKDTEKLAVDYENKCKDF